MLKEHLSLFIELKPHCMCISKFPKYEGCMHVSFKWLLMIILSFVTWNTRYWIMLHEMKTSCIKVMVEMICAWNLKLCNCISWLIWLRSELGSMWEKKIACCCWGRPNPNWGEVWIMLIKLMKNTYHFVFLLLVRVNGIEVIAECPWNVM